MGAVVILIIAVMALLAVVVVVVAFNSPHKSIPPVPPDPWTPGGGPSSPSVHCSSPSSPPSPSKGWPDSFGSCCIKGELQDCKNGKTRCCSSGDNFNAQSCTCCPPDTTPCSDGCCEKCGSAGLTCKAGSRCFEMSATDCKDIDRLFDEKSYPHTCGDGTANICVSPPACQASTDAEISFPLPIGPGSNPYYVGINTDRLDEVNPGDKEKFINDSLLNYIAKPDEKGFEHFVNSTQPGWNQFKQPFENDKVRESGLGRKCIPSGKALYYYKGQKLGEASCGPADCLEHYGQDPNLSRLWYDDNTKSCLSEYCFANKDAAGICPKFKCTSGCGKKPLLGIESAGDDMCSGNPKSCPAAASGTAGPFEPGPNAQYAPLCGCGDIGWPKLCPRIASLVDPEHSTATVGTCGCDSWSENTCDAGENRPGSAITCNNRGLILRQPAMSTQDCSPVSGVTPKTGTCPYGFQVWKDTKNNCEECVWADVGKP